MEWKYVCGRWARCGTIADLEDLTGGLLTQRGGPPGAPPIVAVLLPDIDGVHNMLAVDKNGLRSLVDDLFGGEETTWHARAEIVEVGHNSGVVVWTFLG